MIKILIADEHAIVRAGLKATLDQVPGMSVHCEACTGPETIRTLSQWRIDVVIMDILFSSASGGLETLAQMKRLYPSIPVLLYTISCDSEAAMRAFRIGAAGCVRRDSALGELIKAAKKIAHGGKYFSDTLATRMAERLASPAKAFPHKTLSNREFQIMQMIAVGKPLKEIAQGLFLSEKTISTYRARVLTKLNVSTNADLTTYMLTKLRD